MRTINAKRMTDTMTSVAMPTPVVGRTCNAFDTACSGATTGHDDADGHVAPKAKVETKEPKLMEQLKARLELTEAHASPLISLLHTVVTLPGVVDENDVKLGTVHTPQHAPASSVHVDEQPSLFTRLPSSHSSTPMKTKPSPQVAFRQNAGHGPAVLTAGTSHSSPGSMIPLPQVNFSGHSCVHGNPKRRADTHVAGGVNPAPSTAA